MLRSPRLWVPLLAFSSGVPGLGYQVVWTREVGLLAGSQIEAISLVLVAFFGGLALGAYWLGPLADRSPSPVRLYGVLEIASGLLAAVSPLPLRALGAGGIGLTGPPLLAACGGLLLPIAFLLGGTLPALLRALASESSGAVRHAGRIVGANTAGAVCGVGLAALSIPEIGLRASAIGAGAAAVAIGLAALAFAGPSPTAHPAAGETARPNRGALLVAGLAGVATLGYEVLATRMAALHLGSSLYAWALVLGLFLAGLAAGNLALARRAKATPHPARDVGWIQVAAASALALGLFALRPDLAAPARGLTPNALLAVIAGVLPAAFLMGGAFPFWVRLALGAAPVGAGFGAVSAANTAGGIAGALLAPFALLPALGSFGGAFALAALNAGIGLAFLGRDPSARRRLRLAVAAGCLVAAAVPALLPAAVSSGPWVVFVDEGRQATAVVTQMRGHRNLIVDGDPEASTEGDARRTEQLLALLPLLLHPQPRSFLEVGLGSGITLGTARRFPLERVECVEIARSVIRAARYFEPENRGVAGSGGPDIAHTDARVFLAGRRGAYDVISANTLHPWSVGATGLYSREYFARIAAALRPQGIAVQWLPTAQIGSESLALILRTFFDVFPHGGLWWGARNVIAVGAAAPLAALDPQRMAARLAAADLTWERVGLAGASEISARRIARAPAVRAVLGHGEILRDDRPVLEHRAAQHRGTQQRADLYRRLVDIARAAAREDANAAAVLLWLESLVARADGDGSRADGREQLAAAAGFPEAVRARAARLVARARRDFADGRLDSAESGFRLAMEADPEQRDARFGLAGLALHRGDLDAGAAALERLVARNPDDAEALNELASVFFRRGDRAAARRTAERALTANPFYLEALANAGLMANAAGDAATARAMLARLRALSPLAASTPEQTLAAALAAAPR